MKNVKNVFILTLALTMCVFGKDVSLSKDMVRIDEFLQGYYLHPQPEAVPEMLLLLDKVAKTFKNGEMDGMEGLSLAFSVKYSVRIPTSWMNGKRSSKDCHPNR